MQPNSTRSMIKALLIESSTPLEISELIAGIASRFGANKTKQQIRNALNAHDCRDIVRVGDGIYDLLSRVLNGNHFRFTPAADEIERGILNCDAELKFLFNSVFRDKNQPVTLRSANGIICAQIKFCGEKAVPRRAIEGLDGWFKQWNLCPGDDIIIKVVDDDTSIYEITSQKKELRNEEVIHNKNKEVADLLEKIADRIAEKGGWVDMLAKRVACEYSYKDDCPPDTISRIAQNDKRFCETRDTMRSIYLKSSPVLDMQRGGAFGQDRLRAFKHVFQFMISLKGIEPSIWRRIQVPSNYSFWELHVAIQDSMGWLDCHLHEFQIKNPHSGKKAFIGIPDEESYFALDRKLLADWEEPIADWFNLKNTTAQYTYDFGDNWEHTLKLEKIDPAESSIEYPRCTAGGRACPPEDIGSIPGYHEFIKIMNNPRHPEHKEMAEWLGEDNFDPDDFNCRDVEFDDPEQRFKEAFGED